MHYLSIFFNSFWKIVLFIRYFNIYSFLYFSKYFRQLLKVDKIFSSNNTPSFCLKVSIFFLQEFCLQNSKFSYFCLHFYFIAGQKEMHSSVVSVKQWKNRESCFIMIIPNQQKHKVRFYAIFY